MRGDLPIIVDAMARRYNKLPSELLNLDLIEFNLNSAIFIKGIEEEERQRNNPKTDGKGNLIGNHKKTNLKSFNLDVIKKKVKRGKK